MSIEATRLMSLAKVLCITGLQLHDVLRALASDDSAYTSSARIALANVLEILSGVLSELSSHTREDQPFLDLGEEPVESAQAESLVRPVLEACLAHLEEAKDGRPIAAASLEVRVTTLSCLLK